MPTFAVAIFLSAFLLFQVQPVIARYILPWYGGSPAVWTTCLLFFQVGLLGGYAYAHGLASWFRNRPIVQFGVHVALLFIAFVLLPITPDDAMKPTGTEANPVLGIIGLLATTVGFPYLLLSASGPLLQHWFSDTFPGRSPYRLYAISNAGSILGLVTYPFLFEPLLTVTRQTLIWSGAFVLYGIVAVICGFAFLRRHREAEKTPEEESPAPAAPLVDRILWVAFAACGSMLLLSLTNQMCQDVAVVPFLWVAPLSLYLLTFVISFDHERWYRREIWIPLAVLAVGAVVYLINQQFAEGEMHLALQLSIYLGAIFCGCLVCHGEIVRIKPHVRNLTGFYLAISFGGALGGLFVSVIAPMIFEGYWELHVAFLLLAALTILEMIRWLRRTRPRFVIPGAIVSLLLVGGLVYGLNAHIRSSQDGVLAGSRSFYGVLRIYEDSILTEDYYRALYHGRISHGRQYMADHFRDLATTYYTEGSGIGALFKLHPARKDGADSPMHVGTVGLGIGSVAVYARPGDRFTFYEINEQVETMAREHFSYLEDCKGEVEVVIGDARISMERELDEESRKFDALVVDAFSGDSIPIHLLTLEAFELYLEHLKPDGVLAVHISNLHLDLSGPVRTIAAELGLTATRVEHIPEDDNYHSYYSDWVLLSRNPAFEADLEAHEYASWWDEEEAKPILWTDDYCNLLQVVDWE